jgi:methyl-CpG-binding domain protein 4
MRGNMWKAPVSPLDLIQEHYPGNPYKILVCCLMLNQTTRKQVDKVVDQFFEKYPTAGDLALANPIELEEIIKPLGMYRRRTMTLMRFADEFSNKEWENAKELYGCGKYAQDTYDIFITGRWQQVEPNDHALNVYHDWLKENHVA